MLVSILAAAEHCAPKFTNNLYAVSVGIGEFIASHARGFAHRFTQKDRSVSSRAFVACGLRFFAAQSAAATGERAASGCGRTLLERATKKPIAVERSSV